MDKINLILSNGFEIWRYDMWVMLISNCALVRILMLRFVIPYASMKQVRDKLTETILHLLLLLHTLTAIQHASSVLSSRKNGVTPSARWHGVDKINSCMNKPHLFTLDSNHTMRVMSPSVTWIEHRKIEPITKHLSVCASSATPSWFWSIDDKIGWGTNVFMRIAG